MIIMTIEASQYEYNFIWLNKYYICDDVSVELFTIDSCLVQPTALVSLDHLKPYGYLCISISWNDLMLSYKNVYM